MKLYEVSSETFVNEEKDKIWQFKFQIWRLAFYTEFVFVGKPSMKGEIDSIEKEFGISERDYE